MVMLIVCLYLPFCRIEQKSIRYNLNVDTDILHIIYVAMPGTTTVVVVIIIIIFSNYRFVISLTDYIQMFTVDLCMDEFQNIEINL